MHHKNFSIEIVKIFWDPSFSRCSIEQKESFNIKFGIEVDKIQIFLNKKKLNCEFNANFFNWIDFNITSERILKNYELRPICN